MIYIYIYIYIWYDIYDIWYIWYIYIYIIYMISIYIWYIYTIYIYMYVISYNIYTYMLGSMDWFIVIHQNPYNGCKNPCQWMDDHSPIWETNPCFDRSNHSGLNENKTWWAWAWWSHRSLLVSNVPQGVQCTFNLAKCGCKFVLKICSWRCQ